jgi:cytochrome oxidase Cu insertion factor (SCO1/SenC/PrrC family)
MRAKIPLIVSMLMLLALMIFLYLNPDTVQNKEDIRAEGISSEKRSPAPDFVLKDLTGRPVALDEYKGKVVLLGFWTTW